MTRHLYPRAIYCRPHDVARWFVGPGDPEELVCEGCYRSFEFVPGAKCPIQLRRETARKEQENGKESK